MIGCGLPLIHVRSDKRTYRKIEAVTFLLNEGNVMGEFFQLENQGVSWCFLGERRKRAEDLFKATRRCAQNEQEGMPTSKDG